MEISEENMTPNDMLEKIAELDYSQSQLKDMNSVMRNWLDVAEDEVAMLGSENVALRKQVKAQEKLISEAQQVEAEPDSYVLTDELYARRHSETKIQELEEESTTLKEQNKTVTSEIKIIQQEREQDKIRLSKLQVALTTLEFEMEVTQVELQHKDGDIYQKDLQLKHLEETVEECSNIIKDLRQTNQELREQLEDRQDEALLSALNEHTEEAEIAPGPSLSILEEMKLLSTSDEGKMCIFASSHLKTEEESTTLKEQNKTLTSEQEREQDKISLSKLQAVLKTLEFEMEVTQVELQHKDEDIYQKDLQLKHLEETVEECSNIIKDLRQTNQELRDFLEEEAEEVLKPQSPTVDLQNQRWTGTSNTAVQRARRFLICIFILHFFLFLAMDIIAEKCPLFSICTFWTSAQMMLLPYCSVQYSDLPPI